MTEIIDVHHEKVLSERFDLCTLVRVLMKARAVTLNLLFPKGDQYQFSYDNMDIQSREMVMRINKMITCGRML